MRNRYQLLEHTADIGIAAAGENLAVLFEQMALGLRRVMTDGEVCAVQQIQVEVTAEDVEELLVGWLSELLYRFETERFLPAEFSITEITERHLCARLHGERGDPRQHRLEREVKAVTYHQLLVEPTEAGWQARVYLDL